MIQPPNPFYLRGFLEEKKKIIRKIPVGKAYTTTEGNKFMTTSHRPHTALFSSVPILVWPLQNASVNSAKIR